MSPAPEPKKPVYIEQPSTEDLLDDQYSWLRVHRELCKVGRNNCEHCRRMDRVRDILMQPFSEEKYYSVQIAKRKVKGAGK